MKTSGNHIVFTGVLELTEFLAEHSLERKTALALPVLSHGGSVLVKENMPLSFRLLEKMTEIEEQFPPEIHVQATEPVLNSLRASLTKRILDRLSAKVNQTALHLINHGTRNYRGIIHHAFARRDLLFEVYEVMREEPIFFERLADTGLMTLATSLGAGIHMRMLHRHAFMAGFCLDLYRSGTRNRTMPTQFPADRQERFKSAADYIRERTYPSALAEVYLGQTSPRTTEAGGDADFFSDFFDDEIASEEEEPTESDADDPPTPETVQCLTQIMRIGLYLRESAAGPDGQATPPTKLLSGFAYNTARGWFSPRIAMPIIRAYRKYAKILEHIMRIAEVERKCVHDRGAWAFPKPLASQVLCTMPDRDCPLRLTGGDIHIVEARASYGRMGKSLEPGVYPKCRLESALPRGADPSTFSGHERAS